MPALGLGTCPGQRRTSYALLVVVEPCSRRAGVSSRPRPRESSLVPSFFMAAARMRRNKTMHRVGDEGRHGANPNHELRAKSRVPPCPRAVLVHCGRAWGPGVHRQSRTARAGLRRVPLHCYLYPRRDKENGRVLPAPSDKGRAGQAVPTQSSSEIWLTGCMSTLLPHLHASPSGGVPRKKWALASFDKPDKVSRQFPRCYHDSEPSSAWVCPPCLIRGLRRSMSRARVLRRREQSPPHRRPLAVKSEAQRRPQGASES